MQLLRGKKVWFFFIFGVLLAATAGFWLYGRGEQESYTNGRIVQEQETPMECEEWRAA